jgi:Ca2+-binding RTX toxin-like protein
MAILNGDNASNLLNGTNLADQIYGLAGNDTLVGFDGDDVLEGGAGADELFGDSGFDLASYRGSGAGVRVGLGNPFAFDGDAAGDTFFSIEGVIGSAYTDLLFGSDERNVLRGEGGADVLFGGGGDDLLVGGGGGDVLYSEAGADELRGGAGADVAWYDLSPQAVRVDLAAGTGFGGDAEGDRLFSIEGVHGSAENDRISGNAAANQLAGYIGADTLSGGGGADRFFYFAASDSTVAAPDRILDFSRGQGDKLVVGTMDANAQVNGDQAFQFIGQGAFTRAGQLRWFQQNGDTIVEGNTTVATAGAELRIVLDPLVNLQASDFIFADIGFGPFGLS